MVIALQIVGVLGFVISLINSSYTLISHRVRLVVRLDEVRTTSKNSRGEYLESLLITFENKSQLPIAVTGLTLIINNKRYRPTRFQFPVLTLSGETYNATEQNQVLPIQIQSLGAYIGYLSYSVPLADSPSTAQELTVEIQTNRKKPFLRVLQTGNYKGH